MGDIITVARKDIREILGRKITIILFLVVSAFLGVYQPFGFLRVQVHALGGLQTALDTYAGFLFLGTALALAWGLTTRPFMLEKAERTIETLLTTPLSLRAIWLGKTVAVFAISYPVALANGLALILLLNHAVGGGGFVGPSPLGWLNLLVAAPVLIFTFIALAGLAEMILMHPRIGQFLAFGIFFVVYRAGLTWSPGPELVGVIYCLAAVGLLFIMAFAARFLNRERIVLSIG
ncbi:MAG: hypothetical protein SVX38_14260 [Chloroflexota bacterium]|nr:hypothetical protein [Chloroflexota bacterium]